MTDHEQQTLDAMEREIGNIARIHSSRPGVPAVPPAPTPLSLDDVGHMAADAVLKVYETTAKQVEAMGDEVKERIKRLADALTEADTDLKFLDEAAQKIREKGEGVRQLVEEASGRSRAIREMVDDLKQKLVQ